MSKGLSIATIAEQPPENASINWINARAVPAEVLHMLAVGKQPAGKVYAGPNGQYTYAGPVRAQEIDNSWRDGLSQLPDA